MHIASEGIITRIPFSLSKMDKASEQIAVLNGVPSHKLIFVSKDRQQQYSIQHLQSHQ
jgi:hypothetical protein